MGVVEKAAERLRALQPKAEVELHAAPVVPAHAQAQTTIERLQEREPTAPEPVAAAEAPSPQHIDHGRLQRLGFFPRDEESNWRLVNELRGIKRPLLANIAGKTAKPLKHADRIVVTSAVPGEGKTFTSVNLALSLAREPDFEVLLVDADVAKADVTMVLGLEEHPGLMDVLADDRREATQVVVATDIPHLMVVPSGKAHPLTAELFGGQRMDQVLQAWEGRGPRRRLLVFDSSPILATSDAPSLIAHMGQVVMVVAAGRTAQQDVRLALQSVSDQQYVGLVLNMSQLPRSERHNYGQYGKYYAREP